MARQTQVDTRFRREAGYWQLIYQRSDVFSLIHQRRQQSALNWVDSLGLAAGSPILEVGCGAGTTAAALAQEGYRVVAVDTVPSMIELTARRAAQGGFAGQITAVLTSAETLAFASEGFSMALALGLLPWVEHPVAVLFEMARVVKPGGYVIANVDNSARMDLRLDPMRNPALARHFPPNCAEPAQARIHSIAAFDGMLRYAGMTKVKSLTLGFGPLTALGHNLLPDPLAVVLDRTLQRFADAEMPGLRSWGAQYLVLARKAL